MMCNVMSPAGKIGQTSSQSPGWLFYIQHFDPLVGDSEIVISPTQQSPVSREDLQAARLAGAISVAGSATSLTWTLMNS